MSNPLSKHWKPILAVPIRFYLGFLFLSACWHKILHPGSFALDIATYQILPVIFVNLMAITLPWVELAAGLMLLLGWRTRAGALLIVGMMSVFTLALVIAVLRGLDMSCGCFASQGVAEDPISWATVARDLFWLFLSLFVLFFDRSYWGLDAQTQREKSSNIQENNP
jgi:uncharacterized membrane protein YphA (DoxX/SURF4 family)